MLGVTTDKPGAIVKQRNRMDTGPLVEHFRHLDVIVSSYLEHCHAAGPHQRKENKPLLGIWPDIDDPPECEEEIVCRE